jgi:hypothetical protein
MTAISGVEFLIWLLIAASTIAVLTKYLRIPYTVALVLGGLFLSLLHLPLLSPGRLPRHPQTVAGLGMTRILSGRLLSSHRQSQSQSPKLPLIERSETYDIMEKPR